MIGGKAHGAQTPTALGTLLQASTYGMAIPTICGTTRCSPLAIWAANIREGMSSKKAKKKGVTTYVENIDLLLGSNPIPGILQGWTNNNYKYPLNFIKLSVSLGETQTYTIDDDYFYFLCALTINLTNAGTFNDYGAQGPVDYDDTSEYPLWNSAIGGPDPTDEGGFRWAPYCYNWTPGMGPTFTFEDLALDGKPFNIYYAQLSSENHHNSPLTSLRLQFEDQLGNGDQYTGSFASQQIIYPWYAGVGSADLDLGASGLIPNINLEVAGAYTVYGSRDGDFADAIEDVLKSGPIFTGEVTGAIARGVNCCNFPGPIQKRYYVSELTGGFLPVAYDMPVQEGNRLIVCARVQAVGTLSISDTLANTWTLITSGSLPNSIYSVWQCVANASGNTTVTISPTDGFRFELTLLEIPNLDTLDATVVVTGDTDTPSISTTTSNVKGQPGLMLVWSSIDVTSNDLAQYPPQWLLATDNRQQNGLPTPINPSTTGYSFLQQRSVYSPGTFVLNNILTTADSWVMVSIALKNSNPISLPQSLGDILDEPTMNNARQGARSGGLTGAVTMNSQREASDWLKDLYTCMNAAPVWSGFRLKSICRSEASYVGNGTVFIAPTASGPVANLTVSDFIAEKGDPPITVSRKAQSFADDSSYEPFNIWSIEHINRLSDYATVVSTYTDQGSVALYGPRKADVQTLHEIQDVTVARTLLAIQVRRSMYIRQTYKFTLKAKWQLLEPMDLVTVTDEDAGIFQVPVRLTSVEENDSFELECEAEPFIYGTNAPNLLTATPATPNQPDPGATVEPVNTPLVLEVPPRMAQNPTQPEMWLVVSDPDPNYGGCFAYISTDGGSSYNLLDKIINSATTGVLTSDFPASPDPQFSGALSVDLSESLGTLETYTVAEENQFAFPCYVEGGTTPSPVVVGTGEYSPGPDPSSFWEFTIGGSPDDLVLIYVRTECSFLLGITQPGTFIVDTGGEQPPPPAFLSGPPVGVLLSSGGGQSRIAYDPGVLYCVISGAGPYIWQAFAGPAPNVIVNISDLSYTCPIAGGWTAYGFYVYPPTLGSNPVFVVFADGGSSVISGFPPAGWAGSAGIVTSVAYQTGAHGQPPSGWYELMTYSQATMTSAYHYTLEGTSGEPPFGLNEIDLVDSSGQGWIITVNDLGTLVATENPVPTNVPISLASADERFCYSIGVSTMGALTTTPIAYLPGTPTSILLISPGNYYWSLIVSDAGDLSTVGGTEYSADYLRRAVFGMPLTGIGVDHPINSRFAFLDAPESPSPDGILKLKLDPKWIGVGLYFKFLAFNKFGAGAGLLADAVPYIYQPLGIFANTQPNAIQYTNDPALGIIGPSFFTIMSGALAGQLAFNVNMGAVLTNFPTNVVQYNAREPVCDDQGNPYYSLVPTGYITSISVASGGTGYAIGDTGYVNQPGSGLNGWYQVTSIGMGGVVTGIELDTFVSVPNGTGYVTQSGVPTHTGGSQPGSGSGLTVTITSTGAVTMFVTIYDPGYLGDSNVQGLPLAAYAFTDPISANVGVPGYTYIGALTVYTVNEWLVTPGGWPPPTNTLVNGS